MICCTVFKSYEIRPCNITFITLSGLMVDVDLTHAVSYQIGDVLYLKGINGSVAVDMTSPPEQSASPLTLEIVRDAIDACKTGSA